MFFLPHDTTIVLHIKGVKGRRLWEVGFAQIHAVFPFIVQGVTCGLVNQTMPPGIINSGGSLNLGLLEYSKTTGNTRENSSPRKGKYPKCPTFSTYINPSIAQGGTLQTNLNALVIALGQGLLIGAMEKPRNRRHKHARIGFTHDIKVVLRQVGKDGKKILQKGVQITAGFRFRFGVGMPIGIARSNGMFDVQPVSRSSWRI